LVCNDQGEIEEVKYRSENGDGSIYAKLFVVACNTVESIRLLASSQSKFAPKGLGNNFDQLGKNLISTSGGIGQGSLHFEDHSEDDVQKLRIQGNFVNRAVFNYYELEEEPFKGKVKGGYFDFNFEHSNPFPKLRRLKKDGDKLVYGSELKERINFHFTKQRTLKFETFCDWLPTDDCFVELSEKHQDKWGDPVAKIRINMHDHDKQVAKVLGEKGKELLKELGAKDIDYSVSHAPSTNLIAGGCRFGDDPKNSVLDSDCKVHDVSNLYVTDGSFMPTGGSVPYTWTIYANSFRVAEKIIAKLQS